MATTPGYSFFKQWNDHSFSSVLGSLTVLLLPPIYTLFFAGVISYAFVWLVYFRQLATIGRNIDSLAIKKLTDEDLERNSVLLKQKDEIVKFSLKRFKRNARIIPKITLKLSLIGIVALSVLNIATIFMTYGDIENKINQTRIAYNLALLLIVDIVAFMGIAFVFLYPQIAIKNVIDQIKKERINTLEKLYEVKKLEFLQGISNNNISNESFEQLKHLETMIEETESLLSWPFNYKQFGALIASAFLPVGSYLLTLTISFLIH